MPILTDTIAFVHVPKTSGSWVTRALVDLAGGQQVRGQHDTAVTLTAQERAGRLVLASARDPWSWYASLYRHCLRLGGGVLDGLRAWGGGSLDFDDVLAGWLQPETRDVPAHPGLAWRPLEVHRTRPIQVGETLWSWTMRTFLMDREGQWAVDAILSAQQPEDGLAQLGIQDARPAHNRAPSDQPQPAYTPHTWRAVMDRDSALIGALGLFPHQRLLPLRAVTERAVPFLRAPAGHGSSSSRASGVAPALGEA